jgi:hypothetical protein
VFAKIKLAVLGFIALAFVVSVLTQDWQMFKNAFGLLAFVVFIAFVKGFFGSNRPVGGGSCGKCGGSGRMTLPGNIANGMSCSH